MRSQETGTSRKILDRILQTLQERAPSDWQIRPALNYCSTQGCGKS